VIVPGSTHGSSRLADALTVGRAAAWMIVLRGAKFLVPLTRLARLMAWPRRMTARDPARERRIAALVDGVAQRLRFPDQGNCLERSLVLFRMLGHAGARPRLIVGMRRASGRLAGHAWVSIDGEPVGERIPDDLTPVAVFEYGRT
jgi:hypothetical protein